MRALLLQRFIEREPRTPIALMDLAPFWRSRGCQVDVGYSDTNTDWDYDIIGFSSVGYSEADLAELVSIRNRFNGRLIYGGKATSTMLEDDIQRVADVGIEIEYGPGEHLLGDYDTSDYPVWDEDDFRRLDRTATMTEMMSSRGCPYRCHFCHNTEKKVQPFSTERTVSNARLILEAMGRHRIFLVDDVFAMNAERMFAILKCADDDGLELRRRTAFFVHISLVSHGTLAAIQEYAPQEIQIGIESGDDRMLKAMGKTFTSRDAEARLRQLSKLGVGCACLFLIGFPGETKESLNATVDFVNRNRRYMSGWWASFYQPVPNTVGWEIAMERSAGRFGNWNTDISYIDPNITYDDLARARAAIMA